MQIEVTPPHFRAAPAAGVAQDGAESGDRAHACAHKPCARLVRIRPGESTPILYPYLDFCSSREYSQTSQI
jgi:hypothetical protein